MWRHQDVWKCENRIVIGCPIGAFGGFFL
jgi:hypothetical protein